MGQVCSNLMAPVIDTFLFSEPHETDLLLTKLHVEDTLVDHWVVVENAYSTKGDWKGLWLESVLAGDPRFEPFTNRVTVISLEERFADEFKRSIRNRVGMLFRWLTRSSEALRGYIEEPYFYAERRQRDAAYKAMMDLSGGKGWVIITDVDEMLDATSDYRLKLLEKAMVTANLIHLPRRRFVYDFDNVSMAAFRYVPMARIECLGSRPLSDLRLVPFGVPAGLEPLVFEYSYCYDRESIKRKLATFTHADPGENVLERALNCNHAPVSRGQLRNHHWYQTIGPDEAQHPQYVAQNLELLKTNVVHPDYPLARAEAYPDLFPSEE